MTPRRSPQPNARRFTAGTDPVPVRIQMAKGQFPIVETGLLFMKKMPVTNGRFLLFFFFDDK